MSDGPLFKKTPQIWEVIIVTTLYITLDYYMEALVLIFLSNNCQNLGIAIDSNIWCSIFIVKYFSKHPLNFEVLTCWFLAIITDLSCNRVAH